MDSSKKRILLVTSNFAPEESGIAVYSSDLAFKILDGKFETTVLTGMPHYPWWRVPEEYSHLAAGEFSENGINIIRLDHAIPSNSGAIGRAKLEYSFWKNARRFVKSSNLPKFDLVIAIMPTVASGDVARIVAKKIKVPGVVIFQDVTSLGALQSGMPGARFLYQIAKFLEKKASRWATQIIVVSEEMQKVIGELTGKPQSIEVIHNYSVIDSQFPRHIDAKQSLEKYRDKFLILHTGNIGFKQDLMNVVKTAELLEKESEIHFLLIGHGNQEQVIREAISGKTNIELMPFVSSEEYPTYLAGADLLLVNERSSLREMSLPSKLTSYLVSGQPVIASVPANGATSKFLKDNAYIVEAGNPQELASAIIELKNNEALRSSLGQKGKEFAVNNLSAEAGRKKYLNLLSKALTKNSKISVL